MHVQTSLPPSPHTCTHAQFPGQLLMVGLEQFVKLDAEEVEAAIRSLQELTAAASSSCIFGTDDGKTLSSPGGPGSADPLAFCSHGLLPVTPQSAAEGLGHAGTVTRNRPTGKAGQLAAALRAQERSTSVSEQQQSHGHQRGVELRARLTQARRRGSA